MTQRIYYETLRSGIIVPTQISPGIFRWYSDQTFTVTDHSTYIYNTGVKVLLPNEPEHYLIATPAMMLGLVKRYWGVSGSATIVVDFSTKNELQILINNQSTSNISVTPGMGIMDFAMVNIDKEPVKISPGEVTLTHERWGH